MKSSPNNRLNAIINALVQAHGEALERSKCSLNRMPEYFLATRVADYFAKHFINFGYRLEAPVRSTFENADLWHQDIDNLLNDNDVRSNGRFDLVLRTGRRGRPAHVLEFKKGTKRESLIKDVQRLAKICEHAGTERLRTNYLVFTRKCSADGSGAPFNDDSFLREVSAFERVTCHIRSSEPMQPFMNREYEVVEGDSFQVVVVEIQAVD